MSYTTARTIDISIQTTGKSGDLKINSVSSDSPTKDKSVELAIDTGLIEVDMQQYNDTQYDVQIIIDEFIKGDKGDKGDKGEDGADGADGYTPEKGTDYFTEVEIQDIEADIIEALIGTIDATNKTFVKATEYEIEQMKENDTWASGVVYYVAEEE